MDFEYLRVTQSMDVLQIEDIGNCAIKAFNDMGEEYILVISTQLGTTRIFNYGPINPDLDLLPKNVNCSFKRIQFSEFKIQKTIRDFLNNPYANITQAQCVDEKDEVLNDCRSIIEYMKQDILY